MPKHSHVPSEASVLVLGTGLTMVDVVLSLLDQKHLGPIVALSRRGLLPRRMRRRAPTDFLAERPLPRRVLQALMLIRHEIRTAAENKYDWRSVIDALRPYIKRSGRCWTPRKGAASFATHAPTGECIGIGWRQPPQIAFTPPSVKANSRSSLAEYNRSPVRTTA